MLARSIRAAERRGAAAVFPLPAGSGCDPHRDGRGGRGAMRWKWCATTCMFALSVHARLGKPWSGGEAQALLDHLSGDRPWCSTGMAGVVGLAACVTPGFGLLGEGSGTAPGCGVLGRRRAAAALGSGAQLGVLPGAELATWLGGPGKRGRAARTLPHVVVGLRCAGGARRNRRSRLWLPGSHGEGRGSGGTVGWIGCGATHPRSGWQIWPGAADSPLNAERGRLSRDRCPTGESWAGGVAGPTRATARPRVLRRRDGQPTASLSAPADGPTTQVGMKFRPQPERLIRRSGGLVYP